MKKSSSKRTCTIFVQVLTFFSHILHTLNKKTKGGFSYGKYYSIIKDILDCKHNFMLYTRNDTNNININVNGKI